MAEPHAFRGQFDPEYEGWHCAKCGESEEAHPPSHVPGFGGTATARLEFSAAAGWLIARALDVAREFSEPFDGDEDAFLGELARWFGAKSADLDRR